VIAGLLANRSPAPAAAPFYRAFEAVGTRAADEAFVALRLVLAGRVAEDGAVRRLRALASLARSAATGDLEGAKLTLQRERAWIPELPEPAASVAASDAAAAAGFEQAARMAYFRELGL